MDEWADRRILLWAAEKILLGNWLAMARPINLTFESMRLQVSNHLSLEYTWLIAMA